MSMMGLSYEAELAYRRERLTAYFHRTSPHHRPRSLFRGYRSSAIRRAHLRPVAGRPATVAPSSMAACTVRAGDGAGRRS